MGVLAPLVLLVWLVAGSSLLAVRHVVVTGEGRATAAQVQAAAAVPLGTPLARVDTASVAARVRRLPSVASAHVTRHWPHVLRIQVVERLPVAGMVDGSRFVLLDATGAVVGPASVLPRGLLLIRVPSPSDPATPAALQVLRELPATLRGQLSVVAAPTPEQVELVLRDGRRVVFGSPADGARKAAATVALLRLPGRVFDVSSPGVVTRR